ncbi:hypothetical protein TrispH2_007884 [Trichoplax sp. H2]|nr:hypothetical protein TrispH2_007884 [Trichoplax sp. H2]|eukprot:RDD40832.1 hypothetical protein TrispH2_007884 [Trichoplax sp. H2]
MEDGEVTKIEDDVKNSPEVRPPSPSKPKETSKGNNCFELGGEDHC